ncbi:hypothetical protein SeLEV6574_g08456 [Synchytrium endobioticum]|uniref:Uncharacterized protein n=1 Tax=Synchytrium endobioticum TaxID=286115 RepID=A0A507BZD5_9FUNG|nr:hypothetical protein SeLEV6574_g08456 [Synchytrium endobioticum]
MELDIYTKYKACLSQPGWSGSQRPASFIEGAKVGSARKATTLTSEQDALSKDNDPTNLLQGEHEPKKLPLEKVTATNIAQSCEPCSLIACNFCSGIIGSSRRHLYINLTSPKPLRTLQHMRLELAKIVKLMLIRLESSQRTARQLLQPPNVIPSKNADESGTASLNDGETLPAGALNMVPEVADTEDESRIGATLGSATLLNPPENPLLNDPSAIEMSAGTVGWNFAVGEAGVWWLDDDHYQDYHFCHESPGTFGFRGHRSEFLISSSISRLDGPAGSSVGRSSAARGSWFAKLCCLPL